MQEKYKQNDVHTSNDCHPNDKIVYHKSNVLYSESPYRCRSVNNITHKTTTVKLIMDIGVILEQMNLKCSKISTVDVLTDIHRMVMKYYHQGFVLCQIRDKIGRSFPELSITEATILSILRDNNVPIPDRNKWTTDEDAILIKYFPNSTKLELERLIPLRTWNAIQRRSYNLGLRRNR